MSLAENALYTQGIDSCDFSEVQPGAACAWPQGQSSALALKPLFKLPQWAVWRYEPNPQGKPSKPSYQARNPQWKARSDDPATWASYEEAVAAAKAHGFDGVSFALLHGHHAAFDMDDCRNPATGEIALWASALTDECQSYVEVTPSGCGLRVIGYGDGPPVHEKHPMDSGGSLEIYRRAARFITITGNRLADYDLANIDVAIDRLKRPERVKPNGSAPPPPHSDNIPCRIVDLIENGAAVGERSEKFYAVVGALKDCGWTIEEITAKLKEYPHGIAVKYLFPNDRLETEVARCFDKAEDKWPHESYDGGATASTTGSTRGDDGNDPGSAYQTWSKNPFVRQYKGCGDFIDEYEPISYTLEGILPSGVFYFLTARRSTGKTAFLMSCMFAVALGRREIIGIEAVTQGHVAYLAFENPADIRMKLAVCAAEFHASKEDLNARITIIDARMLPEDIFDQLTVAAMEKGPLQAVFYDTFQAGFIGKDFNDNAEVLKFAVRLRRLSTILGKPSLLVAAHPTKNAGEDNLVPYGGGSVMNECDGNLTLWRDSGTQIIKLHWERVRGPEFEPHFYKIEKKTCSKIIDVQGQLIALPVCVPIGDDAVEAEKEDKGKASVALLTAIASIPRGTQRIWARVCGCSQPTVSAMLKKLEQSKHIQVNAGGQHELTAKGRKELKPKT